MKNLIITGFVLASILKPVTGKAQQPVPLQKQVPDKPYQFGQLAEKTPCRITQFSTLFQLRVNDKVAVPVGDGLTLEGRVISLVQQNAYVTSINILSSNYPGTLLNLSQIREPGKPVTYTGRLVNPEKGDVISISQDQGQYTLHRQLRKYFLTE